jgi:hypothetical protein
MRPKSLKFIFLLFFFLSCSTKTKISMKQKLFSEGYRLVAGCSIFDLDGNILRSYPGGSCLFEDDGSLLSYDPAKLELSKYDADLRKLWTLNLHVHHELKKTSTGEYLVNSSEVVPFKGRKRVRFDEVLLVSIDGNIKKRFSFLKYFRSQPWFHYVMPTASTWEKNLKHDSEVTHIAASYDIPFHVEQNGKIKYPQGSVIVTLTRGILGAVILDPQLKEVLDTLRLTHAEILHDGQFVSPSELMFFKNTSQIRPISESESASVKFYDVFKKRISSEIHLDLYALYTGGVQAVGEEILLISDSNSEKHPAERVTADTENSPSMRKDAIHKLMKGRVIFYNRQSGQLEMTHFDFNFQHMKLQKLVRFLALNRGP